MVNVDKLIEDFNKGSKMKIVTTDYSLATQSYDIFFSGCNGHCKNCHNPESWDFNSGTDWKQHLFKINRDMKHFGSVIKKFFILGGEPLEQDREHFMLCMTGLKEYGKEMWLFTRFSLEEVPEDVKELFDYIKCGPYVEELTTTGHVEYGVILATSNQHIYKKGKDY